MNIIYHPSSQTFHLYNDFFSYIIGVLPDGGLGQYYYGRPIRDRKDQSHFFESSNRGMTVWPLEDRPDYSPETTQLEYPSLGRGDYREPAYEIVSQNGSSISDLKYTSHRIYDGKPPIKGLPHSYTECDDEAKTLEIDLKDKIKGTLLTLIYTIYRDYGVMTRSVKYKNTGQATLYLKRALSMSLDLPDHDYIWMQFSGAWGRERIPHEKRLENGITAIDSLRGHSSHHQNPFVILRRPETTETQGEAMGFSFVYSGNFLALAEVDNYDMTRILMGIHPQNFSWKLEGGDSFETPEVIMSFSSEGLNGLSHTLHVFLRERVARGPWRDRPRPILLNSWEALQMDFTEGSILRMAQKASKLGIELFVLDDGWFGQRTEASGLGDWFVDVSKLPEGLSGLSKKINSLGMDFGVWIEPEMVSPDSELYRSHPDFVLHEPARSMSLGRNQLVLDFSNPHVVDYIFGMLMRVFDGANISYIKWDMNRSISECFSSFWTADRQGEIYHRYILGVYEFYERLIKAYPDVLIESCASGGGRFDAGMLYYAPQAWCSDDTDACERIKIQYGTSYGYPLSSMGAHVSACPNGQVNRFTPLSTRANVAYFGAFGYEMDFNHLGDEELNEIKAQIKFMKENRELIQFGRFYRLISPKDDHLSSWMVVSPDRSRAIVGLYKILNTVNAGFYHIKLLGLDPQKDYLIEGTGEIYGGDELMCRGISSKSDASTNGVAKFLGIGQDLDRDFGSRIYVLREVR